MRMTVHGDDHVSAGFDKDLQWLKKKLEDRFGIETQVLGHKQNDRAEGQVLNRVMRASRDGWEIEADLRHAGLMVQQMGVEDGKEVF